MREETFHRFPSFLQLCCLGTGDIYNSPKGGMEYKHNSIPLTDRYANAVFGEFFGGNIDFQERFQYVDMRQGMPG